VVIVLLIGAVTALVWGGSSLSKKVIFGGNNVPETMQKTLSEEAAKETQKIINDTKELIDSGEVALSEEKIDELAPEIVSIPVAGSTSTVEGIILARGSSIVSTETGKVVNSEGKEMDNSAIPGTTNAPKQSYMIDPNKVPESSVKLVMSPNSITPSEFRVKAGQVVFLVLSSGETVDIFKFESPLLNAVAVGLSRNETRSITFNAPLEKGEYVFYSDFKNYRSLGAVGKMIVE
jgi:plastocyanin